MHRIAILFVLSLTLGVGHSASAEEAEVKIAASSGPGEALSDEEILLDRARDYWEARVAGSRKVLDYYAPPELGGPTRSKDISEFGNLSYQKAVVEGVEVEGDRAHVKLAVTAWFPLPTPVEIADRFKTRRFDEVWIKVDGTWYKKPVPRGFSHAGNNDSQLREQAEGESADN